MFFSKLFSFDYNHRNIELFLKNFLVSAFAANIIIPTILLYLTFPFLHPSFLTLWALLILTVYFFRIYVIKKLQKFIKTNSSLVKPYFRVLIGLIFINNFLLLYLIYVAVSHGISYHTIFIFSTIIITLIAGAMTTLLSVFKVYLYYVLVNILTFTGIIVYYGGETFYLFAIILLTFTAISIQVGIHQYKLLNNITSLNETFEAIFNSSPDGILLIQNTRFKDCNEALVKMFGYDSKEELLRLHLNYIMPKYQPDGTYSVKEMLRIVRIALKKGQHTFEWQLVKKNGDLFWVACSLTKIVIDNEELIHIVYRDITQKKEIEKEKEEFRKELEKQVAIEMENNRKKDKMLLYQSRLAQMGEMISMIAHQWRQPLNAITIATGAIQLKASRDQLDNQSAIDIASNISKFAMHLSSTIDDFRNFFQSNKVKSTTNYQTMIESVQLIVESALKSHNIQLNIILHHIVELHTYENEVKQVLLNLIKNAEDALIENKIQDPQINIIVDNHTLVISDNAGGVPEDIIDKIFDPYFSTKTKKDGTGIGLYMSKMIIEDHCGGILSVRNGKEGAEFTIYLGEKDA